MAITFSAVSISLVLPSVPWILLTKPDIFPVLPPPSDRRRRVALRAAGQGHPHALGGQRVRAALLVDDVWRDWKFESIEIMMYFQIIYNVKNLLR